MTRKLGRKEKHSNPTIVFERTPRKNYNKKPMEHYYLTYKPDKKQVENPQQKTNSGSKKYALNAHKKIL